MTLLLDTHIILWWLSDAIDLRNEVKTLIKNPENRVLISAGSFWEINIKTSIGKLKIDSSYADILVESGFEILDIKMSHTMKLLELPSIHQDPFDRILIAQSLTERASIVTKDKLIIKYPIDYILA